MGICKFCGQSAGLFRKSHKLCADEHDRGAAELLRLARDAASGKDRLELLESRAAAIAQRTHTTAADLRQAYINGWEAAVDHLLDDGNLDLEEEASLKRFIDHLSLTQDELDRRGALTRVAQGGVLRELLQGKIPDRVRVDGELPFNFQKGEQLVWVLTGVKYLEDKVRRSYVGGSTGVSLRVAKGVYYRVGAFRGELIERTQRVEVDQGTVAVTTKHVYFGGPRKSFRVRHDKIVSYLPFADGVGIVRDAASAKPQIFVTGDGWFVYNLLANVAHLGGA